MDKANDVYNIQNDNKSVIKEYNVLWYNTEVWMREHYIEAEPLKQCKVNNCNFTTDKSLITKSAAVVFCISCPGMPKAPPISRAKLPLNQVWLFHSVESPINIPKHDKNYRNKEWLNAMNWSMNYRIDSDIPFPYGVLKPRTIPRTRNYTAIFQRKTKSAAWIVSHCRTESKRETYIAEMRKNGFDIDIYGACGKRLTEDPEQLINKDYKFYLGFENSLCKDYVTEKFFTYYSYDTIVVVRGGADYSYLLPNATFIDTSQFKTVKDIPFPYGVLKPRTIPRTRNYTAIFQRKTKSAAWIVSHCRTESKRETYIAEMRKNGFDIDIYGACGKRLTEDPEQLINKDYKFYLGFENSLCKDYVTEKFFTYYSYDTIVVVRGGADYSYLLPNSTFIDTSQFKTVKELVSFLTKVGSSEELYTNYLRNKEKYLSIFRPINPFCELCEKLNNVNNYRKTHQSIITSLFENACHEPIDIH